MREKNFPALFATFRSNNARDIIIRIWRGKPILILILSKSALFCFFTLILVVVFLALYVNAFVKDGREIPAARTAENIEPPGRLYPREPQ